MGTNQYIQPGTEELREGLRCYKQKDFEEAARAFTQGAQKGNVEAMNNLSACYVYGYGVEKDEVKAFQWLQAAAEGGYVGAYYPLACKYYKGTGTAVSYDEARRWAEKAVAEGASNAQKAQVMINDICSESGKTDKSFESEAYQRENFLKEICSKTESAQEEVNRGLEYYQRGDYKEAFQCFQSASSKGELVAMNNLSACYVYGYGVEKDEVKAFQWIKAAAEGGYVDSYFELARKYFGGHGTAVSYSEAHRWCKKAVEENASNAQEAREMIEGIQTKNGGLGQEDFEQSCKYYEQKDYNNAFLYLQSAVEKGHIASMFNIAIYYVNGWGTKSDFRKAFYWMKAAAEAGYLKAYYMLASFYCSGMGTAVSYPDAERWAEKAVEERTTDEQDAQAMLTNLHSSSAEQNKSVEEKVRWEEESRQAETCAREESAQEEVNRGFEFVQQEDYDNAFLFFQSAADKGNIEAMNNLSVCYANGHGVGQDYNMAFKWMKKSAEGGYAGAYYPLACKYYNGTGTAVSYDEAKRWAEKAVAGGASDAQKAQQLLSLIHGQNNRNNSGAVFQQVWRFFPSKSGTIYPKPFTEDLGCGRKAFLSDARCWTQKALEEGNKDAEGLRIAQEEFESGSNCAMKNDYKGEVFFYQSAMMKGHAAAMHNLSIDYYMGRGVEKDLVRAFELMKAAAEGGCAVSYTALAAKYNYGAGTAVSVEDTKYWLQKAISEDSPYARLILDSIKKQESGLSDLINARECYLQDNFEQEVRFYLSAAEKGHRVAMYNLGIVYYTGHGIEKNEELSFFWTKKAAEESYTLAYYSLARKYYDGSGTALSYVDAKYWAEKVIEECHSPDVKKAKELLRLIK